MDKDGDGSTPSVHESYFSIIVYATSRIGLQILHFVGTKRQSVREITKNELSVMQTNNRSSCNADNIKCKINRAVATNHLKSHASLGDEIVQNNVRTTDSYKMYAYV